MTRRLIARLAVPAVALAAALATGLTGAWAKAGPGWRITATVGTASQNELAGWFTATSGTDAFSSWNCTFCAPWTRDQNFVEHWNGRRWRKIALPPRLNYPAFAIAFSASSASNLWAITNTGKAGIWNSRSWTIRSLPSWVLRSSRTGDPYAEASVFSRNNVWIFSVGAMSRPTLAAHYYGGAWRKAYLPGAPVSISAVASGDIWALAITKKSLPTTKPVWAAMHWDGSAWRTLALPRARIPAGDSASYGITATGPRSVWVARVFYGHTASVSLLHWAGRWRVIKVPARTLELGQMAQDGRGGVWMLAARGYYGHAAQYLYHYGRRGWSWLADPTKPGATNYLGTLTWIPGTRSLWASGTLLVGSSQIGDILKFGP
jgi:hypothetical protein